MKPEEINVLIACEESQAECLAFRDRGFNAYSCDIQEPRFCREYHILDDVTPYLQGKTVFLTLDGRRHIFDRWHLIIAHPPCTFLCKVGSVQLYKIKTEPLDVGKSSLVDRERYNELCKARDFFFCCLNARCDYLAVENPVPMALAKLPKPDCFVHPSWYGVKYTKKTCYWLKNLPPLMPALIYPEPKCYVQCSRGKYRSRTFPAVAQAIAQQWGDYILDNFEYPR